MPANHCIPHTEATKEKMRKAHLGKPAPKWYTFDSAKGSRQKRPPERKFVLVRMASLEPGCLPEGIAVGYRKNAAGDKQSPYFVVPGLHTGTVLAWCDCLPEGFTWPNDQAQGAGGGLIAGGSAGTTGSTTREET